MTQDDGMTAQRDLKQERLDRKKLERLEHIIEHAPLNALIAARILSMRHLKNYEEDEATREGIIAALDSAIDFIKDLNGWSAEQAESRITQALKVIYHLVKGNDNDQT